MDMKDFAKYIKDKSFDEELHKSRRKSLDRILCLPRKQLGELGGLKDSGRALKHGN